MGLTVIRCVAQDVEVNLPCACIKKPAPSSVDSSFTYRNDSELHARRDSELGRKSCLSDLLPPVFCTDNFTRHVLSILTSLHHSPMAFSPPSFTWMRYAQNYPYSCGAISATFSGWVLTTSSAITPAKLLCPTLMPAPHVWRMPTT